MTTFVRVASVGAVRQPLAGRVLAGSRPQPCEPGSLVTRNSAQMLPGLSARLSLTFGEWRKRDAIKGVVDIPVLAIDIGGVLLTALTRSEMSSGYSAKAQPGYRRAG